MAAYKYNRNKTFKNADSLPAGGYICNIVEVPAYQKWDDSQKKYVKVNDFDSADRTAIPFDIVEGEFTNYYQNKFDSDDSSYKSWKGMMYFKHPSENDKWDTYEKKYNSLGAALED